MSEQATIHESTDMLTRALDEVAKIAVQTGEELAIFWRGVADGLRYLGDVIASSTLDEAINKLIGAAQSTESTAVALAPRHDWLAMAVYADRIGLLEIGENIRTAPIINGSAKWQRRWVVGVSPDDLVWLAHEAGVKRPVIVGDV